MGPIRDNETVSKTCHKTRETAKYTPDDERGLEDGGEGATDDDKREEDERGEERRGGWKMGKRARGEKGMRDLEASSPAYIPVYAC